MGQIWSTPEQNAGAGIYRTPSLPRVPGQRPERHSVRQRFDRRPRGSPLHQTRPLPVPVSQPEHLRGLLHHLLARLRLYEALQLLGEQILYFDTDSVVFAHRPGQASPALGQYLGEFKDELGHGDSIVEFCSAGPKNYGYKTRAGQTVCKVRGFSLNCQGAAQLNYQVLRQNVLDELHNPWPNPAPHASPSPTPSNARPKTTPCTPDPPTKITVWCAANVWWIPRRLRAIPTATSGWFELIGSTLVAQWVERWALDPWVAGSSPAEGDFLKKQRQGSVRVTRRAVASEFRVRIPALSFFPWVSLSCTY